MSGDGHPEQASTRVVFRLAAVADAERLGFAFVEGLNGYEQFGPQGWRPPSPADEVEHLRSRLADPDVWCLLAEAAGSLVGQVTVLPAARSARPVPDSRLGHLANLVVRSDFRGTGLARTLHDRALEFARVRGCDHMRLFVAARHGRARRFYEREGWTAVDGEFHDPGPNLVLVEYRRVLDAR